MTLGQRIQELRKGQNLSQEGLGEKLGVSRQAISRWEMDGAVPEVDKLIAMGKLFGVSLNDLLQVKDGPDGPEAQVVLAPAKGWKGWMAALSLVLALSLSASGWLGWKLSALEGRLDRLDTAFAAPMLDGAAPLVAAMDYTFEFSQDEADWTVRCPFTLTAAQMVEGLTVTLQLTDSQGQVQLVELEHAGGSVYSAVFSLDALWTPITCSALFQAGEAACAQPLIRWEAIDSRDRSWHSEPLWKQSG